MFQKGLFIDEPKIKLEMRRAMMQKASLPLVPNAYQRVQYITGDGSSYLSCGSIPSGENLNVWVEYSKASYSGREEAIVYIRSASNILAEVALSATQNRIINYSSGYYLDYQSGLSASVTNSIVYGGVNDVVATFGYDESFKITGSTNDRKAISVGRWNGTKYTSGLSQGTPGSFGGETVGLFANPFTGGVCFSGSIFRAYIEVDGARVKDLIPVYRKSDGEIGVWDAIGRLFYTNAGTGNFTKGADQD